MDQVLRLNKDAEAVLDQIDAELKRSTSPTGGADAAAVDKGALCEKYQAIRDKLEALVKFLRQLGGFGKKAAAAIEFLMSLADIACPVNP